MNDNIFTAENWPDYDTWLAELRKVLAVRGTPIPSYRELGVSLIYGGIDVLAGKLTRSNQLGWAWNSAVIMKAAMWISDHLPQEKIQFAHWERQISAGNMPVFQVISLGTLRSKAEIPLAEVLGAALENRFIVWRFDIVRCSIFNLDFLLTEELEAWALATSAAVVKRRVEGVMV